MASSDPATTGEATLPSTGRTVLLLIVKDRGCDKERLNRWKGVVVILRGGGGEMAEFQFFAVLKSFETTTPANPCFPSLLFRRLGIGFYPEETLRMSFFLGTTRMLLPCSFVAPRLEATAFFRVILRSEGRKKTAGREYE